MQLFTPATLESVTPSASPASASQTITLFGTHFPAGPGAMTVRFGRASAPLPLAWVTSSVATCLAPSHPGGRNVTVRISSHKHESEAPGVAFAFIAEHALLALLPSRVPAEGGC